ncbi:peroxiredoxin family protein [Chitinimonas lacunae]|uniref:Peroxiredoxin family protein n=1 Tax=Chitinimonas lacunae TaxID=1963018 RepID=A0ABV8MTJ1_9NEIS
MSLAPELAVSEWLNTDAPLRLAELRGRVVVIHAFQMLCPGCVAYGIPQAERIAQTFAGQEVVVLGLHTVFEHHAAMNPATLRAFVHEYRLTIPIGIDQPSPDRTTPLTMAALRLRGTPSLVLIDRQGHIRQQFFGRVEDMHLGASIALLLAEAGLPDAVETNGPAAGTCDAEACALA